MAKGKMGQEERLKMKRKGKEREEIKVSEVLNVRLL